jgi:hypothetical protein
MASEASEVVDVEGAFVTQTAKSAPVSAAADAPSLATGAVAAGWGAVAVKLGSGGRVLFSGEAISFSVLMAQQTKDFCLTEATGKCFDFEMQQY